MGALADPRRERYAGQRAMGLTPSAAFRAAVPDAARRTPKSISVSAARLEAEPEIRARIAEITADLLHSSDAYLSKASLAELLSDAIRNALGDPETATSASGLVDKYCRMFGFYEPERHDVEVGCLDEASRDRKISQLLKLTGANAARRNKKPRGD